MYVTTAILLFIIIKIALSIIISLLGIVAKLPILKQFNEAGGLIYGLLRGIIIALILITISVSYANINPDSKFSEAIENSYLSKIIYEKISDYTK